MDHEDYQPGEAPALHGPTHEKDGDDEISVAGLAGETAALGAHKILPSIHHLKYTDAEAAIVSAALIATHAAIATAHQDAPALIATHAALPTVHQDAPALIATHASNALLHHVSWTNVSVYLSAAQDIPSGAPTTIEYDTEFIDARNEFDTDTYTWKCDQAGTYLFVNNVGESEGLIDGDEIVAYIMISSNYRSAARAVYGGAVIGGIGTSLIWTCAVDETAIFRVKIVHSENRLLDTNYTRGMIVRLL